MPSSPWSMAAPASMTCAQLLCQGICCEYYRVQFAICSVVRGVERSQPVPHSNMFPALQDICSCIHVLHIILVSDNAL